METAMFDIITIGSATRDVFLLSKEFQFLKSDKFSTGMGECVALGAKIDVEEMVLATGGGATNAAVTFARLGFLTGIVSRVGEDDPGTSVLADLLLETVDTSMIKRLKGGQTAYSTLLTAANGERTVLVYRGVSADFTAADVPFKTMKARWYYVSSLSGNIEVLAKIITHAKKTGAKVAVNPGSGELMKASELRPLLKDVDVLIVNLEEAQRLSGLQTKDGKELSAKLSGDQTLAVVTDSSRGAYAAMGKMRYSARNRSIPSISRTGAGDAFGSGVVAALMKGLSIDDALKVGTLNAESVIQHVGAKAGILKKWPNAKLLEEIRIFASR
jgi:ribokinase